MRPREPSTSEAISTGWRAVGARYRLAFGASLLVVVISVAISALVNIPLGGEILSVLVTGPLTVGAFTLALRVVRNEPARVVDVFGGFRPYWPSVLVSLPPALLSVAGETLLGSFNPAAAPPGARTAAEIGAAIAWIAFFAAFVYVNVRLGFAELVLRDPLLNHTGTISAADAIARSWALTRGRFWSVLWLGVLLGLIFALSFLLLFVGAIALGAPLCGASWAAYYDQVARYEMAGRCPTCSYPLWGLRSPECPECGRPIPEPVATAEDRRTVQAPP